MVFNLLMGALDLIGNAVLIKNDKERKVHVWIQDASDLFLIQKALDDKGGLYAVTGGKVLYGEKEIDAAVRKVKEQIGVGVPKEEVKYAGKFVHDKKVLIYVYLVKKDFSKEKLVFQKDEGESLHWFNLSEIEDLNNKAVLQPSSYKSLSFIKSFLSKTPPVS